MFGATNLKMFIFIKFYAILNKTQTGVVSKLLGGVVNAYEIHPANTLEGESQCKYEYVFNKINHLLCLEFVKCKY